MVADPSRRGRGPLFEVGALVGESATWSASRRRASDLASVCATADFSRGLSYYWAKFGRWAGKTEPERYAEARPVITWTAREIRRGAPRWTVAHTADRSPTSPTDRRPPIEPFWAELGRRPPSPTSDAGRRRCVGDRAPGAASSPTRGFVYLSGVAPRGGCVFVYRTMHTSLAARTRTYTISIPAHYRVRTFREAARAVVQKAWKPMWPREASSTKRSIMLRDRGGVGRMGSKHKKNKAKKTQSKQTASSEAQVASGASGTEEAEENEPGRANQAA